MARRDTLLERAAADIGGFKIEGLGNNAFTADDFSYGVSAILSRRHGASSLSVWSVWDGALEHSRGAARGASPAITKI